MQFEQKISPALWFDNNAEEAIDFYISIFRNSKVNKVLRYGKAGPGPEGTVMTISFELDGEEFTAINGGPHFTFSPAISFVVKCETQDEVDYYWEKLSSEDVRISVDGLQTDSAFHGKSFQPC